jgi:uncharacterized protein (TIGR01777 family)
MKAPLKEADAVINLGGHPLFKNRWNSQIKALIHDSRVDGTHKIVHELNPKKNKVFINASAIGFYGKGETVRDEHSPAGADYLARVCVNWEAEASAAERLHHIRTVIIRFGVVLGKEGGALKTLLPPFKMGLGGPVGFSGSQSMSWIHLDDVVGIIIHAIENEKTPSILNATAPNVVSNKVFSHALGKVLHRPAFMPLPTAALYLMVGEAAEVVAAGQNVKPKATLESGYQFKFPEIENALKDILK